MSESLLMPTAWMMLLRKSDDVVVIVSLATCWACCVDDDDDDDEADSADTDVCPMMRCCWRFTSVVVFVSVGVADIRVDVDKFPPLDLRDTSLM